MEDVQGCPVTVSEEMQLVKLRELKVCNSGLLFLLNMGKFLAGLNIGADLISDWLTI